MLAWFRKRRDAEQRAAVRAERTHGRPRRRGLQRGSAMRTGSTGRSYGGALASGGADRGSTDRQARRRRYGHKDAG